MAAVNIIEYKSEETIPELESMLILLYDKDEVQTIINIRKEHEYKMHRAAKRKEDLIKFIQFEIKLLKTIRLKHKNKGLPRNSKIVNLEYRLGLRINKLFVQAIRLFPKDLAIWQLYIKFCQQMKFTQFASRVWKQLLDVHGHYKPELFKQAANWEMDEVGSFEKARKYLFTGIHIHKDNKLLLKEAFRLELLDAEKKRKECLENSLPIDSSNALLTAQKAELIYENSIKKMNDVELFNELLTICAEFDFTNQLHAKISADLGRNDNDERMWDIVAKRKLTENDDKSSAKAKIGECVKVYDKAVKRLNTPRMWAYYIDTLQELEKDSSVLPVYKRKLLCNALQRAASGGKLSEKHYLAWVSKLQGPEKHKKLVSVLQGAIKKIPESVTLWHMLLRVHMVKGEEKQANQVFDRGVAALRNNSLPLWKLMLQFGQTKRNNKVEEIFKKSWTQDPAISGPLQPMYLEWLVLTQGIAVARKMYDFMCDPKKNLHICLAMHKKMLYLESIQPNLNLKRIRKTHAIACAQFGDTDVDVWIDHCKFEINNGDPEKLTNIYKTARNSLSQHQFETFHSELSLMGTVPPNTAS